MAEANVLIGLAECLFSTILFGSAFVPIKKFEYGLYSMQCRSISIIFAGFLVYAYLGFEHFYPAAMIGGSIWTAANVIVLPCIGELGLGVAVLLYSFTNCLTNWFTGNFGLFWTIARPPAIGWLNYVGLVALLIGGALITLIRSDNAFPKPKASTCSTIQLNMPEYGKVKPSIILEPQFPNTQTVPKHRRIIAIIFALFSGFLFGEDITPVVAVQDNPKHFPGAPQEGLPYVFSYYLGIFLTSSAIFFIYCIVKKNKPFVNHELTLPSLISGIIWSIAQALFIVCTKHLSVSVSGPIAAILPACVASCWSVFYFKEIKGNKNLVMLCASIGITSAGAACIAFSKDQ